MYSYSCDHNVPKVIDLCLNFETPVRSNQSDEKKHKIQNGKDELSTCSPLGLESNENSKYSDTPSVPTKPTLLGFL